MKRVSLDKKDTPNVPVHAAAVETNLLGALSQLIAHLTHTRYDDGSPRQVGTVSLRTQGTTWCAEARDYDAKARLRVTAQCLDDALLLLDTLLGSQDAPWEPDVYLQDRNPRGRKGS